MEVQVFPDDTPASRKNPSFAQTFSLESKHLFCTEFSPCFPIRRTRKISGTYLLIATISRVRVMFQAIYDRKKQQETNRLGGDVNVSELMSRENLSYPEAVEALKKTGGVLANDPRAHLNPVRVRDFSKLSTSELLARYNRVLEDRFRNATSRDETFSYGAAVQTSREHLKLVRGPMDEPLAKVTEKSALHLARRFPNDAHTIELLTISAGLAEKAVRAQVMNGFENNNIAEAAKAQNRSWLEVRDDLLRFGALSPKDPRAKIRRADIDFQKKGTIKTRDTLGAIDLEKAAMHHLKKNPKDEQAIGWLAATGAMAAAKEAKQVAGTMPPKKTLFGKRPPATTPVL